MKDSWLKQVLFWGNKHALRGLLQNPVVSIETSLNHNIIPLRTLTLSIRYWRKNMSINRHGIDFSVLGSLLCLNTKPQ